LRIQTLLGGTGSQIGWFVLGFGSIFFWVFALKTDLSGWRFRQDTVARIRGNSAGCRKTGFYEGDSFRHRDVYQNLFRYTVDGQSYTGVAYALDQCVSRGPVDVEYLRLEPAVSRIAGMRRRPVGYIGLLGAALPGVGLCIVVVGLIKGLWKLRLLRDGLPAAGRQIQKVATGSSTLNRPDYLMVFEFATPGGPPGRASVCTNSPERLEDGRETLVLYDPSHPSQGLLFRSLPGDVLIDPQGQPTRTGSRAFLFLPVITILANAFMAWRHFAP